jgi:hypothetical protein
VATGVGGRAAAVTIAAVAAVAAVAAANNSQRLRLLLNQGYQLTRKRDL